MGGSTLRVRFAIWTAGLLFTAMALFSLFVYVHTSTELHSAIDASLRLVASQTISAVSFEDRKVSIQQDFEDFYEGPTALDVFEHGLTIQIYDTRGGIIQSFGPFKNFPMDSVLLPRIQDNQTFVDTVVDPASHDPVRFFTAPIHENGEWVGAVRVGRNLADTRATLYRLQMAFLIGIPLLAVFAAIGGYYLAYRALKPIDQITQTARHISARHLSARLDLPPTQDEVGRLAVTLNEMLARLDESFQREHQFVADASHELRTPLTAMQTILSTTLEKQRSDAEYRQAMQDLNQVTNRLHTLVQNLLALARGGQRLAVPANPVDLSVLLEDVADSFRPAAQAKGLELICDVPHGLVLNGDADSLIRLFFNLVDNAVKYTNQGKVSLQASRSLDGRAVIVTLADTGVGIPAEHLPHIFDRFYRVDPSRASGGAGLGLAIAREIARAHGGKIQVESTPGVGTKLTIWLASPTAATGKGWGIGN